MPVNLSAPGGNGFPSLRTIYITGSVDGELAHRVIVALEELDHTDGDIRVVLNSEGGSEQDGYAIHDAVTMCRNRVVIDAYGSVMSIAAAIFMAGDHRRMSPNCDLMIHDGNLEGLDPTMPQQDVQALAEEVKKGAQRYYSILSHGSQQPEELIEQWCKDETTFNAQEALEAGFCDEIIKPLKTRIPKKKKRSKRA
jgi:ATP-dependent Clp protease protease subunit